MSSWTQAEEPTRPTSPFRSGRASLAGLGLLLSIAALAAVAVGPYSLALDDLGAIAAQGLGLAKDAPVSRQQLAVLVDLRLPRVLLAILTGGGLGLAGATMQGLFRNPLAEPGLLGVASGAVVGVAAAIVVLPQHIAPSLPFVDLLQPLCAFGGALLATAAVYRLARQDGRTSLAIMLLAGIAINALAGALVGFLSYLSSDDQLRNLTFWNLGSLGRAGWKTLALLGLLVVPAGAALLSQAAALNVLLLGEAEAFHLGVDLKRVKTLAITLSALIVGSLVSACGIIGFISLVAPHLVRLACGPDHRHVLPGSALCGALLLVLADMGARTLVAPAELPIGILTALLGTPFFLWLLKQRSAGGSLA